MEIYYQGLPGTSQVLSVVKIIFVYFQVNNVFLYFLYYVQDLSGGVLCPLIL